MTEQVRNDKDKAILKRRILETAADLAREKGWTAVSVRKISKRVGYSTIIIYSLFGNKENLFLELKRTGFQKLLQAYEALDLSLSEPRVAVRDLTWETVRFYRENTALYQIMFGVVGIPGVGDICSDQVSAGPVADFVKKYLTAVRDGDGISLFLNWWALVLGFITIAENMGEKGLENSAGYLDEALDRFLE